MPKRKHYEIKETILWMVKENPGLHPNELNKKVGTNPQSFENHLKQLNYSEEIEIKHIEKDPANGQPSRRLYPTAKGNKTLENMKKK